jgi:hypothetical protein
VTYTVSLATLWWNTTFQRNERIPNTNAQHVCDGVLRFGNPDGVLAGMLAMRRADLRYINDSAMGVDFFGYYTVPECNDFYGGRIRTNLATRL